jgi:hypothetical protein
VRFDDDLLKAVAEVRDAEVAALIRAATEDLDPLQGGPPLPLLDGMLAAILDSGVVELADRRGRGLGRRVAVAAVVLGLTATGAAAAAATGSLPASVQDVIHDLGGAVGLDLPAGSQDGEGHGRSDEAPGRPEQPGPPVDPGRSDEAPGRPDDPGQGNQPPVDPGRPEEPGNGTPPTDPGNGNGNPPSDPGNGSTPPTTSGDAGGNSDNTPGTSAPGRDR